MLTNPQYLETMGIDIWVRRALIPPQAKQAQPAQRQAAPVAKQPPPSPPSTPHAATPPQAPAQPATSQAATAPHAPAQPATSQASATSAAPSAAEAPAAASAAQASLAAARQALAQESPAPATQPPTPAAAQEPKEPAPQFRLAFLAYTQLGLCLHLAGDLPRQFCDDLARALGEDPNAASLKYLDWPLVKNNPAIDQSLSIAQQAVAEALAQLPARVLAFGEALPRYCPPLADASPGAQIKAGSQTLTLLPDAAALMASAEAKRRLWQQLQG